MTDSKGIFYRPETLLGVQMSEEVKGVWPEGKDWVVVALLMPVMLCGIFYYKEKKKNINTLNVKEEKKSTN